MKPLGAHLEKLVKYGMIFHLINGTLPAIVFALIYTYISIWVKLYFWELVMGYCCG